MQIDFSSVKWLSDVDGTWLMLKVKDQRTVCKACGEIAEKKINSATLERKYEKRTNDANRYCWILLEKLAKTLEIPKEEIYREQVRLVPQKALKVLVKASEVDAEISAWCKSGLGCYVDVVGESTEHKGYVWLDKYKGTKYVRLGRIVHPRFIFSKKRKALINDAERTIIFYLSNLDEQGLIANIASTKSTAVEHTLKIKNIGYKGQLPKVLYIPEDMMIKD